MNWKLLGTMVTLIGVGASVALGQGTTPTIVQGDYISNVFGNSNFIKNPNAKLNTKDVTFTGSQVVRSATTPLVATSEFNLSLLQNANADWSTRTFDAGMKGQNCEARFTYRGFSVGSTTAQILQGANVVAQLTLTASTDPRIASINFPCGDLLSATTFRLQQATASLTGTNEIGGIYVGLATNMANVAQAEMVGGLTSSSLSSRVVGTANVWTDLTNTSGTVTAIGKATSASTTLSVTFANLPAGEYQVIMNQPFFIFGGSGGHSCRLAILETTSGDRQVIEQSGSTAAAAGQYVSIQAQTTARFAFTTAGSRTFKVQVNNNGWTTSANGECYTEASWTGGIFVYRFPSSSELVVTPERQNVWAGVVYTASNQALFSGSAEPTAWTPFNNATWNQPTLLKGKASVTTTNSGNDLGFSVANLPVGNYKFDINGLMNSGNNGSTAQDAAVQCNFKLIETTTNTDVARQSHVDTSVTNSAGDQTRDYINSFSGVFNNTSVATRNFRIEAQKIDDTTVGNVGVCQAFSASGTNTLNTNITILMTPLDQPSNSALYVQGPVKAAQTGAAIPAGYVNSKISDVYSYTIAYGGNQTVLTKTYPAGNYLLIHDASVTWPASISIGNYTVHPCYLDGTLILGDTNIPVKPGLQNTQAKYLYVGYMVSDGITAKTFSCSNFGVTQTATSSGTITAILLN